MPASKYRLFHKYIRALRKEFPEYTFRVRRIPLRHYDGYCMQREDGSFDIRIRADCNDEVALSTLEHEAAHMLSWGKQLEGHGVAWGKAYAKLYKNVYLKYLT